MAGKVDGRILLIGLAAFALCGPPVGAFTPDYDLGLEATIKVSSAVDLPFAHGNTFATLDEYLAHLRKYAGPVGQPWYREIRPGVYELVTTLVPPGAPQTYTRDELLQIFGFSR